MRSIPLTLLTLLIAAGLPLLAAEPPAEIAAGIDRLEAGDFEAAGEIAASVPADSAGGWVEYVQGRVALAGDDYAAAIDSLEEAVGRDAGSALFRRWLGEAYLVKTQRVSALAKMGPATRARETLAEAVALDPSYVEARELLVDYYLNAPAIAGGSVDKALAQAAELTEISALEGQLLRARIHLHEEEYDEAAAAYRTAAESRPEDARLRFRLGMAEQQREAWDAATAAFEEAIRIDSGYMDPYYQLGRTAVFSQQQVERGIECLGTYLDHARQPDTPGHEHAQWRLGMLHELRGDKNAARTAYEAALAIDPEHQDARKALDALGG